MRGEDLGDLLIVGSRSPAPVRPVRTAPVPAAAAAVAPMSSTATRDNRVEGFERAHQAALYSPRKDDGFRGAEFSMK